MFWRLSLIMLLVAAAVAMVVQHTVTDSDLLTIARAKALGDGKGVVTLKGTITYANGNTFVLDDGTGQVELSTCPMWYKVINLRLGDKVSVVGEVMRNPSLSVRSDFVVSVYKIHRGREQMTVRGGPGKPPWDACRPPDGQSSY